MEVKFGSGDDLNLITGPKIKSVIAIKSRSNLAFLLVALEVL